MSSREIALWLDERWYQALSLQLRDETVEDKLNDYLNKLIAQMPEHVREKISREIQEEKQRQKLELEVSQKVSAFRVTEGRATEHVRMEQAVEMLNAASYVQRWLRQTEQRPFQEMLSGGEKISAEEFDRMALGLVEKDGNISGVYDVNLDTKEFSAVRPALGWVAYQLKDVSTASWHSYRTGSYDRERREARFMEKLTGKEIPSAGHLAAEQFSFIDEITTDHGWLTFYLENCFNVDKVFGMRTAKQDGQLNINANYDMDNGQICDALELVLVHTDGTEESSAYPLNAVEKAVLLQKMDSYCQQQTGLSLKDYNVQQIAEKTPGPSGPVM